MIQIRPLTLDDVDGWAALLAVSFGRTPAQMVALLRHFYGERQLVAWGAWDGLNLAAQYSCLLTPLWLPGQSAPQWVGMSMNMAVHPDYRGRGLIKQVAEPVYAEVVARGGMAGVGFSNEAGVQVDKKSKGYGYQVVGKMVSLLGVVGGKRPFLPPLTLTTTWADGLQEVERRETAVSFAHTPESLRHRFAQHPFRSYGYGVAEDGRGVVIYRPFVWRGLRGASLLTAYGQDVPGLMGGWVSSLANQRIRLVHLLTSPQSTLRQAAESHCYTLPLPRPQNPHYLTAKLLTTTLPPWFFDFSHWNCCGGDIL
ncbi:MAG: GNAT family N-acetyltransferase [Anaerolineales bacterium]|nr:GNAT family N-acetyltransferase [Anaerolineales bacterium]